MDNYSNNTNQSGTEGHIPPKDFNPQEFQKIWDKTELSTGDFNPDQNKGWSSFLKKVEQKEVSSKWIWKVAAAIIILISCTWLVWDYSNSEFPNIILAEAPDTVRLINLPDGSKVWLNETASITYAEDFNSNREVNLSGEAFFEVTKLAGKTFKVLTATSKTTVLGTSFNVKESADGAVKVQVATGKVAFEPRKDSKKKVLLTPGEEASISEKVVIREIQKQSIEDKNFRSWQNQILAFHNQSISEITKKLSEHFHRNIQSDESLANCRFTVSFDHSTLEEALEILKLTGDLEISTSNNQINITGKPCN